MIIKATLRLKISRKKRQYGEQLVLHGGISAELWNKPVQIKKTLKKKIPLLKKNGGYIFASDHSIPSSVSLTDFVKIIEHVKEVGSYVV